jgi:hypothetical protein
MVFCPSSRTSCEYYGIDFDTKRKFEGEQHDMWLERNNLIPKRIVGGSENYFPQQSRDYALSHTIKCDCTICPANSNSYCEVPSLININAKGQCRTGLSFIEKPVVREPGTEVEKRDSFTPEWFFNRWDKNCPMLNREQQLAILQQTSSNKWDEDVLRVHRERAATY